MQNQKENSPLGVSMLLNKMQNMDNQQGMMHDILVLVCLSMSDRQPERAKALAVRYGSLVVDHVNDSVEERTELWNSLSQDIAEYCNSL